MRVGPPEHAVGRSSGTEEFLPERAISALQSHPGFQDAVRAAIDGLIERYSHNRVLNRVFNDRGRAVGGLIALYLHYTPAPGGRRTGLTVGRFQAFCVDLKLCSPGRAWALLALMRFAGYLEPDPEVSDRRQHRLVPTEALIEVYRQTWKSHFEAMALVMPEGRAALEIHSRPEFMPAFLRRLGVCYLAGFRVLHHAPELARVAESNAGLLLVLSLFSGAVGGVELGGTAVPISISALSARFGIARAHARRVLADAAEAGLVRRASGSETVVVVLPRLACMASNFVAALFALLGHCAEAAAEEMRSVC